MKCVSTAHATARTHDHTASNLANGPDQGAVSAAATMASASQLVEVDPAVFLNPTITTILAGPERSRYAVHKALLCQKSGYFATAYNASMEDASENTLTISDVPDAAFRTLISWLYTGKVFLQTEQGQRLSMATSLEDIDDEASQYDEDSGGEDTEIENEDLGNDDDESIRDGWYEDSERGTESSDDEMECDDEAESHDLEAILTFDPRSEAFQISRVFPGFFNLSDLDAYQLSCLIRMHEPQEGELQSAFSMRCKNLLRDKEFLGELDEPTVPEDNLGTEGYGKEEIDIYDHLIDVYVLADRFDIQGLRIDIMNLLENHRLEQEKYITETTLPRLTTIAKACETLPTTSDLRLWFVHRMAFDCPARAEDLDILPKDFLIDVMATMAQKAKWLWTQDDWPQYQDECLCHAHESLDEVKRRLVNGVKDEDEDKDEDQEGVDGNEA